MERVISASWIWCEFSYIDTDYLIKIQIKAQHKLEGPTFPIHLTLAGPLYKIDKISVQLIKNYCGKYSPIKLKTNGYDYKEKFFKSLYIDIEKSKELEAFREKMYRMNCTQLTEDFTPHISLVYGDYRSEIKEEVIYSLPTLKKELTIDKVSIISTDEAIKLWKPIYTYHLDG